MYKHVACVFGHHYEDTRNVFIHVHHLLHRRAAIFQYAECQFEIWMSICTANISFNMSSCDAGV